MNPEFDVGAVKASFLPLMSAGVLIALSAEIGYGLVFANGSRTHMAESLAALPNGTPVIVSGGGHNDGTVRVWRLADSTPVVPPLGLPEWVQAIAVHGNVIVTAAGADIAVHQPALPQPMH